jgi:hypothetical protein
MFSTPPPVPDTADPAPDLARRQLAALERMTQRCERVAEAMERRLLRLADCLDGAIEEQNATNAAIGSASLAFDRANRGVRLAVMLQTRILESRLAARLRRRDAPAAGAGPSPADADARRDAVRDAVEAVIEARDRDRLDADRLLDRDVDGLPGEAGEIVPGQPIESLVDQILARLRLAFDADDLMADDEADEDGAAGFACAAPRPLRRQRVRVPLDLGFRPPAAEPQIRSP